MEVPSADPSQSKKRKKRKKKRKEKETKGIAVAVFGASGACGRQLVRELINSDCCDRVVTLGRRKVAFPGVESANEAFTENEKLTQVLLDYPELCELLDNSGGASPRSELAQAVKETDYFQAVKGCDSAFGCLGITKKKAGSQAAQFAVDHDYTIAAAKLSLIAGVAHFGVITSMGSSASSSIHYTRMKGLVEQHIAEMAFPVFSAFRPSFLIANREVPKPGEGFTRAVLPVLEYMFIGPAQKYKSIKVENVGKAIRLIAESEKTRELMKGSEPTTRVYLSDELQAIADSASAAL